MDDILLNPPTNRERSVLISAATTGRSDSLPLDWAASDLLAIVAGYLAIENAWPPDETEELIERLLLVLESEDPALAAAAATAAGTLMTWWTKNKESVSSAQSLAAVATSQQPNWVFGWLLSYDCFAAQKDTKSMVETASRLQSVDGVSATGDEFRDALETIFTGRIGWNQARAIELVARANEAQRLAEGG